MMTKLSVNINKIALLRNSRGQNLPDVQKVATDLVDMGVHGITVHPRPDGRHILLKDVVELSSLIHEKNIHRAENEKIEFNVEGFPSHEFLDLMTNTKPDQCTLVPDPPEALTSNAGWALKSNLEFLTEVVGQLRTSGIRTSLFIDVFTITEDEVEALLAIKPHRVELYTERYAKSFGTAEEGQALQRYKDVAIQLYDLGFGINAGHDLNQKNLRPLLKAIPMIEEVSIGHALICEALYDGLEVTVKNYLRQLQS